MNYLIVGASSGLGRDLAYKFAENSNNLILVSRDERDLKVLKSDIETKFNTQVKTYSVDCSSHDKVNDFINSSTEVFNKLDGAFFPIGMIFEDDTIENKITKTNELIQANYGVVAHMVSELIKIFEEKNSGVIVGFGSISAYLGREVNAGYSASKRALESLFESLALSTIKKKINIQFYVLGYLESNMTFGRKLILPKGSTKNLANVVFKNISKKYKKIYFPFWWGFISYVLRILPFTLIERLIKFIK